MPPHHHDESPYPLSTPGFWHNLFSPAGFMPRLQCGEWTRGEVWLHTASDFLIWTAYLAIPIVLIFFWYQRRASLPFRSLFLLFGIFIIACGTTHLMDIVMFFYPIYRFAGLVKLVTAAASWGTVMALIPAVPRVLAMRSPDDLEAEVLQRTRELQAANAAKDDLLHRESIARQEAEAARQEAERVREEAESASRSKDEFLMVLSHELRTPLNAIQGWASLLQSQQFDTGTKNQALQTIERNAWAQAHLIDDLLEISRITTGKLVIESSPVNMQNVVEAALASVMPTAHSKGVKVEKEIDSTHLVVSGDASRLQQIVWNLLSNAIKFTPKNGRVKVVVKRLDSSAQIEVSDTGEGIAPEFLPYVFDRFRQADSSATRRHGGLGLGLSIVRQLSELHGGTAKVDSPGPSLGSTFTVTLPLRAVEDSVSIPSSSLSGASASAVAPRPQVLRALNILVVDDELEARTLVSTILNLHGAQTRLADSASAARQLMAEWTPDLIVSDVGMPDENGYQFMQQIRAEGKSQQQLPALALTAYASAGDRKAALEAGFNSHLAKPVLPATLVTEVALLSRRLGSQSSSAALS